MRPGLRRRSWQNRPVARSTHSTLSERQREVLQHLAEVGPQELDLLARKWWGTDDDAVADARDLLDELCSEGHLRSQHVYPAQMLWQKIDPKSLAGRQQGALSFYRVTREGKHALRR